MTSNDGKEWLEQLKAQAKGTFWDDLGCVAEEISEEKTVVSLKVEKRHMNSMNIVHGGVLSSLLDSTMGLAVMRAHPMKRSVTTNLNVHFVASLGFGTLTTTASIIHETRSTVTVQASIHDQSGKLGTIGTSSFRLLD